MWESGSQAGIFDDSEKDYAVWVSRSKALSLSLRKALERLTSASGYLSWQSPAAGGGGSYSRGGDRGEEMLLGGEVQNWPTATANPSTKSNGLMGPNLIEAGQNWPSARAEDAERAGNHPGATDSLTGATQLWPTAQSGDAKMHQANTGGNPTLYSSSQNWPSPCSRDPKGVDLPNREGGEGLPTAVANWATPNTGGDKRGMKMPAASAARKEGPPRELNYDVANFSNLWATPNTARRGTARPEKQAARKGKAGGCKELAVESIGFPSSHPTEATSQLGHLLSVWRPPLHPRLNPVFQWWLMGLPWPMLICSESEAIHAWWALQRRHFMSLLPALI